MAGANALVIPQLQYPAEYVEDLKRFGPMLIASMERDGIPIESGSIKFEITDSQQDLAYFYFNWVSEINDVVENLNLTLSDLATLSRNYLILGGSPWGRYELLVRVFFHEFYRFREIFNTVMHACVKRGFISKDELPVVRDIFHAAIRHAIELRNSLVHGSANWTGKAHFDLNLASMAYNMGRELVSRETGEAFSLEAALQGACDKSAGLLHEEGCNAVTLMSEFVKDMVRLTRSIGANDGG